MLDSLIHKQPSYGVKDGSFQVNLYFSYKGQIHYYENELERKTGWLYLDNLKNACSL